MEKRLSTTCWDILVLDIPHTISSSLTKPRARDLVPLRFRRHRLLSSQEPPKQVTVTMQPPPNVDAKTLALFSGYIVVAPSNGINLTIPYIGPAYLSAPPTRLIIYLRPNTSPGLPSLYHFDENDDVVYNFGFAEVNTSTAWHVNFNRLSGT